MPISSRWSPTTWRTWKPAWRRGGVPVPLQVMQSRGGLSRPRIARQRPVRLFLSGPAAGVVGGVEVGRAAGIRRPDHRRYRRHVAATSRWSAGGEPLIRAEGVIDGYPVRVPMVDVTAIGCRRRHRSPGSTAPVRCASARIRPAPNPGPPATGVAAPGDGDGCLRRAGLYRSWPVSPAGTLTLRAELARARRSRRTIAAPLGMSAEQAALGIHRVLNAQMAEAIRLVSIGRGIDPRGYALLPLGGGGPMHATARWRDELGITAIIVPPHPGVLSAAGLLGAPVEHEVSAAFPRRSRPGPRGAGRGACADSTRAAAMR